MCNNTTQSICITINNASLIYELKKNYAQNEYNIQLFDLSTISLRLG